MKLASLLTTKQILLDMKSTEHIEAVDELVDHAESIGLLPNIDKEEVLDAFHQREDQVSTGIGCGIAIPHIFLENLTDVICVFGRSKQGVEFDAIDYAPVNYIVLFIVPSEDRHKHLQTLAAIAKLFNNCAIRKLLAEAETVEEILVILNSTPSRTQAEKKV